MITLPTGKSWLRVLSVERIRFLLAMQSTTPHPTEAKTQAGGAGAPWNLYVTLIFWWESDRLIRLIDNSTGKQYIYEQRLRVG